MKKHTLFPTLLIFIFLITVSAQDPCVKRTWQNAYPTSWILNDGGTRETRIPHSIKTLAVTPDGTVATSCTWDEGGANVIVYNSNGSTRNVPLETGTGSWGRNSLGVVALDNNYTYHLHSQDGCSGTNALNTNGLPTKPLTCGDNYTWKTVRRYNVSSGNPAPFSAGYGFASDMLMVHVGAGSLTGLAVYKNELFVSDELGDSVKVYNKTTMSSVPLRKFHFPNGIGRLSPDKQGCMWMLQPALKKIIQFNITTGVTSKEITFPESVIPTAFFVDTIANRILVADNGVNQNIRIYNSDVSGNYIFSTTFGNQGGMASGVQGKYAPLKFFELSAVGTDAQGNIYVGNSVAGNGGALLQAYNAAGTLLWEKRGLTFVQTACPDPIHPEDVYGTHMKVKMDYSKTAAGSEWAFDAYTYDRLKYPDDPRNHRAFTSPWVRYINGQKFLFMTDMYGKQLAGYRFSPATDGEVAIPCLIMNIGAGIANTTAPTSSQPDAAYNELELTSATYPVPLTSNKDYIWMDKNGNGSIESNEFTYLDGYYSGMSSWVDNAGNLWKEMGDGARFIPLKEVNAKGVPIYDLADSKKLNLANNTLSVKALRRIVYDSDTDELYITGFSAEKPDAKPDGSDANTWWAMGSTVCMYKDVLKTLRENPTVNFQNVTPTWRIFIPFYPEGNAQKLSNGKGFTVAGEFLFVSIFAEGKISVYKRSNGEYMGQIAPGVEVGNLSGWADINHPINVLKTPTEYLVFNEEDYMTKVILYRIKSLATNDILYSDMVPTEMKTLNSSNVVIDYPGVNQSVKFSLKIKNIGPGLVPQGSTFTNGRSFLTQFSLKNVRTGISTIILTDTCTQAVLSGDSIQLTTKAVICLATKGQFSIIASVNPLHLGVNVTECNTANNTFTTTFNNYEAPYIASNPSNLRVAIGQNARFSVKLLGLSPITYQWYIDGVAQANSNDSAFIITNVPYTLNLAKVKCVATNSYGAITSTEAILTVFNQNTAQTVKINFQPAASNGLYTPAGFLVDNGEVYGSKGTYSYGWGTNIASNTRQRINNSDPTSSTIGLQAGNQNHLWKIALTPGEYYVTIVAGDPSYSTANNTFLMNDGTTFTDLTPKTSNFDTYSAFIQVKSNGILSLTGVAPYTNGTNLCYITIADATVGSNVFTPSVEETLKVNFQPTASNGLYTPTGYMVDNGTVYGNKSFYSYGWEADISSSTRQRITNSDPTSSTLGLQAGNQNHLWKIALTQGKYYVTMVAGDPSYTTSNNSFLLNDGTTFTDLTPKTSNFDTYSALVTVGTNGFLSFTGVTPYTNGASICYIWITTATPAAPTITSITPASGQLSVNFVAGSRDGFSDITNYKYSTNGGTSFTACSPAQTTSPILIGGLTNGTSYNVQLKAVNANGDGKSSASMAATPNVPLAGVIEVSDITTSVDNINNNGISNLSIYPNPASNNISILTPAFSGEAKLSIVNLQGQVLYTRSVNGNELIKQDVSAFTQGCYFIVVNTTDKLYRNKFLINKTNK